MNAEKQQRRTEKAILAALEELGGKANVEEDITYGDKLVIPRTMNLRQLAKFAETRANEEEEMAEYHRTYDYRPYDGAWCMWNAFTKQFGLVGTPAHIFQTFFGPMSDPPRIITIPVDVDKTAQIPWGDMVVPAMRDVIFSTGTVNHPEKGILFRISAEGPKKRRHAIEGIFNLVQRELQNNSLYRGKAIDCQENPTFVDVFSVDPAKVIYSQEVMRSLGANIWSRIRHPQEFNPEELKRAVVIHGPFGTGKTLACMLTGQVAVQSGQTFIRARPGRDSLQTMLQTARLYAPCVVFCEDVDQELDTDGDRSTITQLLDDLDGIEAKGTKILAVFTTNYPERIHEGMSRPGRIDAFIEINDLDMEGVRALVKTRLEGQLEDEIDWQAVFEAAEGYKPAFVTEFASRTKSYLINEYGTAEGHQVGTAQLVAAAEDMRSHYERTTPRDRTVIDPVGDSMRKVITETLHEVVQEDYLVANGS